MVVGIMTKLMTIIPVRKLEMLMMVISIFSNYKRSC